MQWINISRDIKNHPRWHNYRAVRFVKKSANAEIKQLERDELNGQSINFKVSKLERLAYFVINEILKLEQFVKGKCVDTSPNIRCVHEE